MFDKEEVRVWPLSAGCGCLTFPAAPECSSSLQLLQVEKLILTEIMFIFNSASVLHVCCVYSPQTADWQTSAESCWQISTLISVVSLQSLLFPLCMLRIHEASGHVKKWEYSSKVQEPWIWTTVQYLSKCTDLLRPQLSITQPTAPPAVSFLSAGWTSGGRRDKNRLK